VNRVVVIGDALLDRDLDGRAERLAPDAPVPVLDRVQRRDRPGGAGLAAALAAAAGDDVTLVCALGADATGARVLELLQAVGVAVCDLGLQGETPEKVRVRAGGRALVRLDGGGAPATCGPLTRAAAAALRSADAVLVSDYGRGVAAAPTVRAALLDVAAPIVWDPHPRGAAPIEGCTIVTPNAGEAEQAAPSAGGLHAMPELALHEARARTLRSRWGAVDVCVTLGSGGALLTGGDGPALAIPARPVAAADPCGAGDCFAATAAGRLAGGALPSEAARAAVAVSSAFVAAGGAAAWTASRAVAPHELGPTALARQIRDQGGTVVATGGCFDLLHAGHIHALEAARALGDCLIVCLNSDASVARLKGSDRPLVTQDDRAAVLAALRCVDAVAVFEEDDPRTILRALRPHLWAKGGDYAVAELPEAETLAEWGGHAVVVPYVAGRSTTRLIEEALIRAG
jgi:rfaE bifunctional protein nucleotidyltransferase chain/domain/rfaE bifunctional protein kinase chain/domain